MKKPLMYRQGDILIRQIGSIPTTEKSKTHIVAVGEGHHDHALYGDVTVYGSEEKGMYFSVNSKGVLEHNVIGTRTKAEHEPIELPAGNYEVVYQRQYNPYEKAIERVRD